MSDDLTTALHYVPATGTTVKFNLLLQSKNHTVSFKSSLLNFNSTAYFFTHLEGFQMCIVQHNFCVMQLISNTLTDTSKLFDGLLVALLYLISY